jgi:hypothetical protein
MNPFAWIRSFTVAFCDLLAAFTTLKGGNRLRTLEFLGYAEYYDNDTIK